LIAGIALTLGVYVVPAIAQQPAAQQPAPLPYQVAVIDLAQVIRAHPDFTLRQEALKKEVDTQEAQFKARGEGIEADRKKLDESNFRAGTEEYQRAFDSLAAKVAQFEADARAQQRRFALQNSQIMFDTFKDIQGTIGRYSQARNIAQVTDYRIFEPDPADPSTVAEDMDQRLVWFNPGLNITNVIIQEVRNAFAQRNPGIPLPPIPTANAPQQRAVQ